MKKNHFPKLFVAMLTIAAGASLASCGGSGEPALIDYAHNGSCKLTLEYSGKDFYTQGVGQFDLWMAIDGDTAHFTPKAGQSSTETVKCRFYGIDTPESTGRIQEYGKQASNFTKEKLKNAAEHGTIVLAGVSSAYAVPEQDANGRHLACVWINETVENAPINTLVNLNLWIMQEGFSAAGSLDKMPEYADVFTDALMQAKNRKLKMYSGEKDPLFNYGEYIETDICDIMRDAYANMDDPTHELEYKGAKVKITGTVSGYANNSLYIQKYDVDEEKWYGINLFCGMTKPNIKYLYPGNLLSLCGIVENSENFGFQVTGLEGHFPEVTSLAKDVDVHILAKGEGNVYLPDTYPVNTGDPNTELKHFTYTAAQMDAIAKADNRECVNSPVTITESLTVNYFNKSQNGKNYTIGFKEAKISIYLTEAYAGDPDKPSDMWTTAEKWYDHYEGPNSQANVGKKMKINFGIYVWHNTVSGDTRYQLLLKENADLVWVKSA